MKNRLSTGARSVALLVVLFAAALSVSNPDISWYPVNMTVASNGVMQKPVARVESSVGIEAGPLAQLQAQLATDDMADQNPFANLSSEVPLQQVFAGGVARFQREALRSGAYRDESGYDILHYEIEQSGGRKAHLLAYLDRSLESLGSTDGEPEVQADTLVVMVLKPVGEGLEMAVFRDGVLIETSAISTAVADSLVAQRLNNGIPFLSVAR